MTAWNSRRSVGLAHLRVTRPRRLYGGEFFLSTPLSQEEQLTPSFEHPSTHSLIMNNFRCRTILPMLQATSSMRLTIEQSLKTIASTRAALATVDELARTIDVELHWRGRLR